MTIVEKEQGLSEVLVFTGVGQGDSKDSDYMGVPAGVRREATVPAEILEAQIEGFLRAMGRVISRTSEKVGEFRVGEVRIQAEVTGEGKIGIAGLGASAGGTAGIVFVFKRE